MAEKENKNGKQPGEVGPYHPPKAHRFSSTNQPPRSRTGRKKSKVAQFAKEFDLSNEDVSRLAKTILSMSQQELTEYLKDDKIPVFVRVFAKMMLEDLRSGKVRYYEKLLDRAIGPLVQKIENTGNILLVSNGPEDKL